MESSFSRAQRFVLLRHRFELHCKMIFPEMVISYNISRSFQIMQSAVTLIQHFIAMIKGFITHSNAENYQFEETAEWRSVSRQNVCIWSFPYKSGSHNWITSLRRLSSFTVFLHADNGWKSPLHMETNHTPGQIYIDRLASLAFEIMNYFVLSNASMRKKGLMLQTRIEVAKQNFRFWVSVMSPATFHVCLKQ